MQKMQLKRCMTIAKAKTIIPELQGELVEFLGDTQQSVVDQIIFVLKSRGMTGKLRLI